MAIPMATPWLHPKTGVWYLRKRVPLDLVAVVGRSLEKRSLGTKDAAEAKRRFAVALGELEARWRNLRAGLLRPTPKEIAAIAGEFYRSLVADAERGRYSTFGGPWLHAVADAFIDTPDDAAAHAAFRRSFGKDIDTHLAALGMRIDPAYSGALDLGIARAVRDAQTKSVEIVFNGDGSPDPAAARYPTIATVMPDRVGPKTIADALPLGETFDAYATDVKLAPSTIKRWRGALLTLSTHLGHDDLRRVTTEDVDGWVEFLRTTDRAPRTIRDVHLASLKSLSGWCVEKKKLTANPATGLRIRTPKAGKTRTKGLTDDEARTILRATLMEPPPQLGARHAMGRRWIPWLAAYSGARINELTQLRRQDVYLDGGIAVMRITPEAGSVKTDEFRLVPIHAHVLEQGFLTFVEDQRDGPLFYEPGGSKSVATPPYKKLGERLAAWVRAIGVDDPRVDPNHGWRHRFKTMGRRSRMELDVLDAIQGHAARTEGGRYGEFEAVTLAGELAKFPRYEI